MGWSLLSVLGWSAAVAAAGAAAVLWLWALVGLLVRRAAPAPAREAALPRFVVVIPAHDEEARLAALLANLAALEYPQERYQVWVVADNCSDATAEVAGRAGVRCLRRDDLTRIGKGWALDFAFAQLDPAEAEAVVVLDADTQVGPQLLSAFAAALAAGKGPALQASYRLRPEASTQSLLLAAENLLEDRLFYGAKGRLGFPVLLRGNGMCLTLPLLQAHPWRAFSITEDAEYAAALLAAGVFPQWVEEAQVSCPAPRRRAQFLVQRARWGAGHHRVARRYGLRLLWQGLRTRRLGLCDAGVGMFLTSKSALLAVSGGVALLGWLLRAPLGTGPAWLATAACGALVAYCLLGLLLCRPTPRQLAHALLALPGLLLLRGWVHLRGLGRASLAWQRTPE